MGFSDRQVYSQHLLGSITTSGAAETLRAIAPSGILPSLIQPKTLTERYSVAEVWVPVGLIYVITTGITTTAPVLQLRKNGIAPNGPSPVATAGIATIPIAALGPNELFQPFTNYTFAAADAAGDAWSVIPTTSSAAGVINPVYIVFGGRVVPGVSDGVSV